MSHKSSDLNCILGQLEVQIAHLHGALKDLKMTLQNLGERVSSLELSMSFWRGGLGVLLFGGSVLSVLVQFWMGVFL